MNLSLDLWSKPGKRFLNVAIISTEPQVKELKEVKDMLMIYLWDILSSKVRGNPEDFSRLTEVIFSEHHQHLQLTLPSEIVRILMETPDGEYSLLDDTTLVYNLNTDTPKTTVHAKTEHFLHLERDHNAAESPPTKVMLKAVSLALAHLGIEAIYIDGRVSKDTEVQTALASYHIGFDLLDMTHVTMNRQRTLNEFSKIKHLTIEKVPFVIRFSRTFMGVACLCSDCYVWIRWPTDEQTASFVAARYTHCVKCSQEREKRAAQGPKTNAAAKKRATANFIEAAMKKLKE